MNSLISNKRVLLKEDHTYNNALNICYCFDDNYALGAGVSLTSLAENNKAHTVIAHLFVLSLSPENEQKIVDLANTYTNLSIIIYRVNNQFDISSENKEVFPLSAALRVLVPSVLYGEVSKVLYLDCDTLVCNDLFPAFSHETDKLLLATSDIAEREHLDRLGLEKQYFNSGVMLINVTLWHEYNVTEKLINLLNTQFYQFPDQDALNIILNDQVELASTDFNHQVLLGYSGDATENPERSIVIHYLGADKPWFSFFITDTYKHYFELSPWRNQSLKKAKSIGRIKKLSKKMRKINKLKSFKLHLYYRFYKLFNIK